MGRKYNVAKWADRLVKVIVASAPETELPLTDEQIRCLCMSEIMMAIRRSKGVCNG